MNSQGILPQPPECWEFNHTGLPCPVQGMLFLSFALELVSCEPCASKALKCLVWKVSFSSLCPPLPSKPSTAQSNFEGDSPRRCGCWAPLGSWLDSHLSCVLFLAEIRGSKEPAAQPLPLYDTPYEPGEEALSPEGEAAPWPRESRLPEDDERPPEEYDQPWEWKKERISKAFAGEPGRRCLTRQRVQQPCVHRCVCVHACVCVHKHAYVCHSIPGCGSLQRALHTVFVASGGLCGCCEESPDS